jgi:hypothetical protein
MEESAGRRAGRRAGGFKKKTQCKHAVPGARGGQGKGQATGGGRGQPEESSSTAENRILVWRCSITRAPQLATSWVRSRICHQRPTTAETPKYR